jgi:glucokinase
MDYGGTNVKAGLFGEDGSVIRFREQPLARVASGGTLLENLLALAREICLETPLLAGGFAAKGLVDTRRGTVEEDIGAGELLAGIDLRSAFSTALGVPFVVENDARAYAWGEWLFGAGRGAASLVCLTLGTGIGCAVVSHGSPYRGADQFGGLLGGHLSIDRHGIECACGSRGCLERYCSATALRARIVERFGVPQGPDVDVIAHFFELVRRGDTPRGELRDEFVRDLALGVVNVIHAYGPDVVVLGGGILASAEFILPPLVEEVHRRAWTFPRGSVRIVPAQLGSRAAALGAAFYPHA